MTEKAKRRIPGTRALGGQMPVFGLILVVVAIAAGALLGILQLYLVANQRSDDLHSLQTIARYAEQLRLYEGKVLATEPDAMDRLASDGSPIRAALDELEARGEIYSIEHLRSRFDAYLTSFAEEERLIANGELGSAVTLHKTWTVPAGLEFRSEVNRQLGIAARAEEQARRIAMVGLVGAMTLAALLVSGLLVAFDRNRRRAIDLLSRQELRFRSLIEYGSDVTLVLEADGRIQFVTPAVEHVFGFRPDKLMGKNLLAMVAEQDRPALRAFIADAIGADGEPVRRELRFTRSARVKVTVEAVGASRIEDPAVGGIVISARDVSERKNLLDSLQHQAHHDSLTSLPNRLLLTDRLEQALYRADRHGTPVAVLFIDLDGFKSVNDRIGHSGGDQLLIAVAQRLRAGLRVDDTLARLGGDEFVVVLEGCDQTLALEIAGRLVSSLRDITVDGGRFDLSASVGIAIGTGPGVSIDDLLHQSDQAMYRAKSDPDRTVALFRNEHAGAAPMAGD